MAHCKVCQMPSTACVLLSRPCCDGCTHENERRAWRSPVGPVVVLEQPIPNADIRNAFASCEGAIDELRAELDGAAQFVVEQGHLNERFAEFVQLARSVMSDHRKQLAELRWWTRTLAAAVLALGFLLGWATSGCSGAPFSAGQVDQVDDAGAGGEPSSLPSAGAAQGGSTAGGTAGAPAGAPPGGAGGSPELGPTAGAGGTAGAAPSGPVLCPRDGWRPSAFASFSDRYGGPPALAVDGDEQTRWTGGKAQAPGQWFQVELPAPVTLAAVDVASVQFPGDAPARLELVLDGERVPATVRVLKPGTLEVTPATPRAVSSVRLELLEERSAWWSIDELTGWCGVAL